MMEIDPQKLRADIKRENLPHENTGLGGEGRLQMETFAQRRKVEKHGLLVVITEGGQIQKIRPKSLLQACPQRGLGNVFPGKMEGRHRKKLENRRTYRYPQRIHGAHHICRPKPYRNKRRTVRALTKSTRHAGTQVWGRSRLFKREGARNESKGKSPCGEGEAGLERRVLLGQ